MNEEINRLEERLRAVEGHIKLLLGGAAALAVCALAFLGIEYWRVPRAVQAAVAERIDHTTLERITEANTLAENWIKNAKSTSQWDPVTQSGSLLLGDTLVCYGTASLQHKGSKHTYSFDFSFPKDREFFAFPAISESVRTKSNGETYAVFSHTLTATAYTGVLNEAMGRDDDNPVTMSYVAIGKAK